MTLILLFSCTKKPSEKEVIAQKTQEEVALMKKSLGDNKVYSINNKDIELLEKEGLIDKEAKEEFSKFLPKNK